MGERQLVHGKGLAAALLAAFALALAGQQLLTPLGRSRELALLPMDHVGFGFSLLAVAGLIAGVVVRLSETALAQRTVGATPGAVDQADPRLLRAAVGFGALATGIAFLDPFSAVAIYPWAAGLSLLIAACRHRSPAGAGVAAGIGVARRGIARAEIGRLLLTLAVAALLRFPGIAEIPAQVHGDEAACGIEARSILAGQVANLLGIGWYDIPNLSFAISAGSMAVFGDNLFGLRVVSAILGVASVALLYFLVRRLYGVRAAAIASFLLAVSHWHVHFSRVGTDYMQASFAGLLALLFLVRAIQGERLRDWVATGLAIGMAASVYQAGRVVPLIIGFYLACEWWRRRGATGRRRQGVALMVMAAVLFVGPTLAVMGRIPAALTNRTNSVFVLSTANLKHSYETARVDDAAHVLALQLRHSLAAFNRRGERSEQHNHRAALLDYWTGPVFAVGLVAFTLVCWMPAYRLIAIWFWLNLCLGSILTVDAMFSPRMIVAVPVLFVFPALIIERAWRLSRRAFGPLGGRVVAGLTVMFLALSAQANYADYFHLHVRDLQPAGPSTTLSRYVLDNEGAYRVYVLGRFSMSYDTPRFLVPDFDGVDVGTGELTLPLADIPAERGAAFVIDRSWDGWSSAEGEILAAYPTARRSSLYREKRRVAFSVMTVERSAL